MSMNALQTPFFTAAGEAKGTMDWPSEILAGSPSLRVLHEAIVAFQSNQRRGTSATKTRGLVSGGGRKPWKQKGTGNARSGSIRSPLWRKGGIIFGPQPRSYRKEIGTEKKMIALLTALLEKAQESGLAVIDAMTLSHPRTGEAQQILKKAGHVGRVLLVLDKKDDTVYRAMRNIKGLTCMPADVVCAHDVAVTPKVLFTKLAVEALARRFPKG